MKNKLKLKLKSTCIHVHSIGTLNEISIIFDDGVCVCVGGGGGAEMYKMLPIMMTKHYFTGNFL